jgi:hypothetical protein
MVIVIWTLLGIASIFIWGVDNQLSTARPRVLMSIVVSFTMQKYFAQDFRTLQLHTGWFLYRLSLWFTTSEINVIQASFARH